MHTSAARARKAAPLMLVGLLIAILPLESDPVPAASAVTTPIPLSLGFSPSALYTVADGIPVYTVGETIWALSDYNYSVPLSLTSARVGSSATGDVAVTTTLGRGAV